MSGTRSEESTERGGSDWPLRGKCFTLVDLLRERAALDPGRPAYTFLSDEGTEQEVLTYGQLDEQARAVAAYLQTIGTAADRVLLLYPPGLDFLRGFFGCLYAGFIPVPLPAPARNGLDSRIAAVASDAKAGLALTAPSHLALVERSSAQTAQLAKLKWAAPGDVGPELARQWRDPGVGPETIAFLQYTSGSTSSPKGVIVTHGNILANQEMIRHAMGHTRESLIVSWLPHFHDMGLVGNILQPLYVGFPAFLMSPAGFLQRPYRWLEAISRYGGTSTGAPNFAYEMCVRKTTPEQRARVDLSRWSIAYCGAEPIRAETLEDFARAFAVSGFRAEAFYPCYGLAEATVFVSGGLSEAAPVVETFNAAALEEGSVVSEPRGDNGRSLTGCGRPWLEERIEIVEPGTSALCREGQIGEIWVAGPHVAKGYWNRSELTKEIFEARLDTGEGPFLRTGDLGFFRQGELYVTGRCKDLIIIRGLNHYPQDIEWTVERSHPGLRPGCSAAFSAELDKEERLLVLAEVDRRHRNGDLAAVAAAIRQALVERHGLQLYGLALVLPGRIPKTSSGKIRRQTCRTEFLTRNVEALYSVLNGKVLASPQQSLETFIEAAPAPP